MPSPPIGAYPSSPMASRKRMALMAAQSIVDCLEGRVPEHLVNKEVLERRK